jgi:transposase
MTGVYDTLERLGWDVVIADAQTARGLAPLTCKTDKTRCAPPCGALLASARAEIWLPDPFDPRRARTGTLRLHLVKHRSALKNRIHSTPDQLRPAARPASSPGRFAICAFARFDAQHRC